MTYIVIALAEVAGLLMLYVMNKYIAPVMFHIARAFGLAKSRDGFARMILWLSVLHFAFVTAVLVYAAVHHAGEN